MDAQLVFMFQLFLAILLGCILGAEREYTGKVAGTRTYGLVSLGAALFTILSLEGIRNFAGMGGVSYDPLRIAGQVVVGIGFIGAGIIIHQGLKVKGLTTAAGLWVSAAIGMAVGFRFYTLAIFTTLLTFVLLYVIRLLNFESWLKSKLKDKDESED
jgi:putative Mg2+ transporter-C (MgtC) family protein